MKPIESRKELLNWVNTQLAETNCPLKRVEDLASGQVYLKLLNQLYPNSIKLFKNVKSTSFLDSTANFKLLSTVFVKFKLPFLIDVDNFIQISKLASGSFQDNLRLLQFIYRLFRTKSVPPKTKNTTQIIEDQQQHSNITFLPHKTDQLNQNQPKKMSFLINEQPCSEIVQKAREVFETDDCDRTKLQKIAKILFGVSISASIQQRYQRKMKSSLEIKIPSQTQETRAIIFTQKKQDIQEMNYNKTLLQKQSKDDYLKIVDPITVIPSKSKSSSKKQNFILQIDESHNKNRRSSNQFLLS